MKISVVINTKNAAETLERALKSVSWADQIVVMDMHSSDATEKIAKKFKADFYTHADVGYVEPARNAAIKKAIHPWVLILDADEEIPATLAERITSLVNGDATADAYFLPRKNIVFGEWYQHAGWWPDYQLRFFKAGHVVWADKIHAQPTIHGIKDYLAPTEEHAILHYNYQTIEQFVERLNRYTNHEVTARPFAKETLDSADLVRAFSNELFARLFKHRGIDGGLHGTSLSYLQAMYESVVVLKQWQNAGFTSQQNDQELTIAALRKMQKDLNYWIADWHVERTSGLEQWWWRIRRKYSF